MTDHVKEEPATRQQPLPTTNNPQPTSKKYAIDPDTIPRPNFTHCIYRNASNESVFETDVSALPPMTNAHYIVKETHNSSCRLIRSTCTSLPLSQSAFKDGNFHFGLYFQPFCEQAEDEMLIPVSDCASLTRFTRLVPL